jgi:hydrophobic/amphiphilic exporter-1 (mainly G- bacteria), HAE1 family
MSLGSRSVNRPVLTLVVYTIIIILGIVSLSRLSIDLMPEITYPTITVFSNYGNVGPQEIEEMVTRPIEEALSAVSGVETITSSSGEGESRIRVSFAWGTDLDVAANDIRDRLDRVIGRLPDDMEKPTIRKFDTSSAPVMMIGVSSDLNPIELRKIIDDQIKYRLERVPGVASADIRGGLNREIHVEFESSKLKAYGISIDDIITSLKNDNQNIPAGDFEKGTSTVLIRTLAEYSSVEDIKNTVVKSVNGTQLKLKDVAEVSDSWEEADQIIRINGTPGVTVSISKQSGANTVQVVEKVNEEITIINKDFSQLKLLALFDSAKFIKQSINSISVSAIWGGFLAVLILFLFLRNAASTLIIATAIPVSIIATFGLMYFGGFTLNTITFGGLALGIGMLLDSSIVVLENIYRHRESGALLKKAAIEGADEVWSAILSSTLTTVVVFFPVIFIRGMSGIIFKQMAYVVGFALLCSLFVALTLIPMLSSKFLHTEKESSLKERSLKKRIYEASGRTFSIIEDKYRKFLKRALSNQKKVVAVLGSLLVISVALIPFIGVELMPTADEGEVSVSFEMAVGTKLEIMDEASLKIEKMVKDNVPEAVSMMTRLESDGGSIRIRLVSKADRGRSSNDIADDLRRLIKGIPGVSIRTRSGGGMNFMRMNQSSANELSVEIRGYDLSEAQKIAIEVENRIKQVEGITDTDISRAEGNPEQIILIDKQKAADLGLSVYSIGRAVQAAVSGSTASYYREHGKQYRIILRLKKEDRTDLEDILDLTVVNNKKQHIALRNVVRTEMREGPAELERKDQERIIEVTGNFTGRDLGSIISDTRELLKDVPVPKDFAIIFGGDYEEQQKAFKELMLGFILALVLVYLVMAAQFESLIDPFVILFSIPVALIGIVAVMMLTGTIFSMQAFIGCIMLAGIVVNNAILLVDYTNQLRFKHGMEMIEAVCTAGARRLRPILMTTSTTVLGLLPLSFGLGEGGESQAPLARVVIGGLLSSTVITLILIPVIYTIFEEKVRKKKA